MQATRTNCRYRVARAHTREGVTFATFRPGPPRRERECCDGLSARLRAVAHSLHGATLSLPLASVSPDPRRQSLLAAGRARPSARSGMAEAQPGAPNLPA